MFDTEKKRQPKTDIKYSLSLTDEQKAAKAKILESTVVFLVGEAGTSKTFTATSISLDMIFKGLKSKIVITRPTVSTEDIGFLPGTFEEKMEPWLVPIRDNMRKFYNNPAKLKKMEDDGIIEVISLSHFRGRHFSDTVCIVDEFENLTFHQLKMAIGRLGKGSIMIFCGDIDQIDLKQPNTSAIHSIKKLSNSPHVSVIELTENHRHPAVHDLLELLK